MGSKARESAKAMSLVFVLLGFLLECMYLAAVFTRKPGESYRRRLRSFFVCGLFVVVYVTSSGAYVPYRGIYSLPGESYRGRLRPFLLFM